MINIYLRRLPAVQIDVKMSETICGICREDSCDFESRCGHLFHENCLDSRSSAYEKTMKCPSCGRMITKSRNVELLLKKVSSENFENFEVERADMIPLLEAALSDKSLPSKLIIEKFIEKGCKINEPFDDELTAIIHLVADAGRSDLLEFMISSGADVNLIDREKGTPLHYATRNKDLEMIKALISNGADLNVPNSNNEILLHVAAGIYGMENYELIEYLLEKGANPSALDKWNSSPLMVAVTNQADIKIFDLFAERGSLKSAEKSNECFLLACESGDLSHVNYFIEKGADFLCKSESGRTGLHAAAELGEIEVLEHLLSCGVDVNSTDIDGSTPLLIAADLGCIDSVQLLVSHGANLDALCRKSGWTSFQAACIKSNPEIAEFLLDSGADVSIRSEHQQETFRRLLGMPDLLEKVLEKISDFDVPFLHAVCEFDDHDLLMEYIDKGFNLEALNYEGETPIFWAEDPDIIDELLERSVNLNVRNNDGMTPFLKACKEGNFDLFETLIETEAIDINESCNKNKNALHYAVEAVYSDMVQILIEKGVDVNQVDNDGKRPVSYLLETIFTGLHRFIESPEQECLQIISEFKDAGAIFTSVDCDEYYANDPIVKAYMELVTEN